MSYILEALKKAELTAGKNGMPSLLSGTVVAQKGGRSCIYPLIAALFVNAGMIFWWSRPWLPKDEPSTTQHSVAHYQIPIQPPETPTVKVESGVSSLTQELSESTRETMLRPVSPQQEEMRPADLRKKAAPATGRDQSILTANKTAAEKRATPGGKVLALKELPPAVKQTLPEFRVSGHAYAPEPSSRVVRINEQILQEGQSLAPGLRVEEITPNGVILDRQGFRFQIGINTN